MIGSTNVIGGLTLTYTGETAPKRSSPSEVVKKTADVFEKTLGYEPFSDLLKTFSAWVAVLNLGHGWKVFADMADFPLMNLVKSVGALSKWVIKTVNLTTSQPMGRSVPEYGKDNPIDRSANWTLYTTKMVGKVSKAVLCCAKVIFNVPGVRLCGLAIVAGVTDMASYTLSCVLGTKDLVIDSKRFTKEKPTCTANDFQNTSIDTEANVRGALRTVIKGKYGNTKSEYFNEELEKALKLTTGNSSSFSQDNAAALANRIIDRLHPAFKAHQKKAILAHVAVLVMDLALLAITVLGFVAAITGAIPILSFALLGLVPCLIGGVRHGLVDNFKSSAS